MRFKPTCPVFQKIRAGNSGISQFPAWPSLDGKGRGKAMSEPAAFRGYIVDGPKNVGTHKEVMLTVRFPAELGKALVSALPWPTRVNPVHVAIALLENQVEPGPTAPLRAEARVEP